MNRCIHVVLLSAAIAATALMGAAAHAQTTPEATAVRNFPKNALRGTFAVVSPPDVKLDGKAARLSPGSRIRGIDNLMVMSASVVGREFTVNYTLESNGLVHDVWILTDAEIKEKRATGGAPRSYLFSSEIDSTPRDDGKTPYNQLPGYGTPR